MSKPRRAAYHKLSGTRASRRQLRRCTGRIAILLVPLALAGVFVYFWLRGQVPYIPSPFSSSSSRSAPVPSTTQTPVPSITAAYADTLYQCPAPLSANVAPYSACWYMEWLTMRAASLQPRLRGTPRMSGNWSAVVSGQLPAGCESNPLVYPTAPFARPVPQDQRVAALLYYATDTASLLAAIASPRGVNTTIVCRQGVYSFTAPLVLGPADTDLTIMGMPGEDVVWTGSAFFAPTWTPSVPAGVWSTPLPSSIDPTFNQMYVDGGRQTRARWPNGNASVNTMIDGSWYTSFGWASVTPPTACSPVSHAAVRVSPYFPDYNMGYNGSAVIYDPPQNYWAISNPVGGESSTHSLPTSVQLSTSRIQSWQNLGSTIMHASQCHGWGSWQFYLQSITGNTIALGAGGWQEARGCSSDGCSNCGWPSNYLYVENQYMELDSPGEWYVQGTTLYYWSFDATPPAEIEVAQTTTIVRVRGSTNVRLQGITFQHTSSTFMSPTHSAPGGGDWANTPLACIEIVDCTGCSVVHSLVTQVGGNGVSVGGSSTDTLIAYNEITHTGANAVAVMGTMTGFDASAETTQPRDTVIRSNLLTNVGQYNKQSGMVLVALCYRTVIDSNVMAVGPREAVNFQDGLGGGHALVDNVIIGTARESNSGSAVNVWNRVAYSIPTAESYMSGNVILCDNNGRASDFVPIVLDDGAMNWVISGNTLLGGGVQAPNFGFNVTYASNLIVSSNPWCWAFYTPYEDPTYFYNNSCVLIDLIDFVVLVNWNYNEVGGGISASTQIGRTWNNTFYTQTHLYASPEFPDTYINYASGLRPTLQGLQSGSPAPYNEAGSQVVQIPANFRSMGLQFLGLPVDPCGVYTGFAYPSPALQSSFYLTPTPAPYTDSHGQVWSAFPPTYSTQSGTPPSGVADAPLYGTLMASSLFFYVFSVPNARYSVTLMFYDFDQANNRNMFVALNRVTVASAFAPMRVSTTRPTNLAFNVTVTGQNISVLLWGDNCILNGLQIQFSNLTNHLV